jgi:hypothetical protein
MSNNQRCINYGGYDETLKTLVCGIEPGKTCAGYNRKCALYAYYNPSKRTRGDPNEG